MYIFSIKIVVDIYSHTWYIYIRCQRDDFERKKLLKKVVDTNNFGCYNIKVANERLSSLKTEQKAKRIKEIQDISSMFI